MGSNIEGLEKLTLKGRISIGNAQQIYTQIRALLKEPIGLNIYLSEIIEIDLAFLQILYSILLAAGRKDKELSVFIDDPTTIWDLVVKAGFENYFNIIACPGGADFQIEGNF